MGDAYASPEELIALFGNMSVGDIAQERLVKLSRPLIGQVETIAARHHGRVPLHGRLFAQ